MKKLLFYCESGGFGGMERILVETMIGLSQKGYSLTLFMNSTDSRAHWKDELSTNAVRYHDLDIQHLAFHRNILRAFRLMRKETPDIIHFYLGSANSCQSAIIAAFLCNLLSKNKSKLIASEQGDSRMSLNSSKTARYLLKKITLSMLSHTICVSQQVRKSLLKNFSLSPERTSVIYNSVDPNQYSKGEPSNIENEIPFSLGNRIVFAIPARLDALKGHRHLVSAVATIKSKIPNAVFLFLGDGPEEKNIRKTLQEMALEDTIWLLGFKENMIDFLSASNVLILPSLSEGLPLSVLEGMSIGLPIIATSVGGLPELVVDGKTGYLAAPGDSAQLGNFIIELYNDKEKRERMGRASRIRVEERFNLQEMILQIEALYQRVLRE